MRYEWLDEYCLSKKGTQKDFKVEWDATREIIEGNNVVNANISTHQKNDV